MIVKIRQEQASDYPKVFDLLKNAFGQEEEARLVDHLRKNPGYIPELSLVAFLDSEILGHILFTKIKIREENGNHHQSLALAPLAVMPGHQGKGIGGELIKKGLKIARELGYESVIVLGHEGYYPKFGFLPAEKWQIKAPFPVPQNVFMGIELVKDGLKNVSGTVIYPEEFDLL